MHKAEAELKAKPPVKGWKLMPCHVHSKMHIVIQSLKPPSLGVRDIYDQIAFIVWRLRHLDAWPPNMSCVITTEIKAAR